MLAAAAEYGLRSALEAAAMIRAGRTLVLAGDDAVLGSLPRGAWAGGTVPFFMTDRGARATKDFVFVAPLPEVARWAGSTIHSARTIQQLGESSKRHGFSFLIVPGMSRVLDEFARCAPTSHPVVGWVAGVALEQAGTTMPRVFDGSTGGVYADRAVAFQFALPDDWSTLIEVANVFEPGDGDPLVFESDGFSIQECLIGGRVRNFAEYLATSRVDTRLPLVSEENGHSVNAGFRAVDHDSGIVHLYAPVRAGVTYRVARAIRDYAGAFERALPPDTRDPFFACNCALNHVHGALDGPLRRGLTGPLAFGVIAGRLLNQALVVASLRASP